MRTSFDSRLETICRLFSSILGFVGIIILSWGFALLVSSSYYDSISYDSGPYSTATGLGFWILFIVAVCFSLVINTFALVLSPTLTQHGGMAYAGLVLGWDLVVLSTFTVSLVFNSWAPARLGWGDGVVGKTGTDTVAERGLTAVYAFNAVLFLVYIALIVVDCKRVHRHRRGKLGAKSGYNEPSIEMPTRGTAVDEAEAGSRAKFVPSVRSAEGAEAQHGRDFV
ncbi:hypothetical protein MBLNU457_g2989t1 [Dothideomycetes sp. NU457]